MDLKFICPICNALNDMSENKSYEYQKEVVINKKKYWITYFRCSKCKKIICLQIDDYNTSLMLKEEQTALRQAMLKKKNGKRVSKKITEFYHKTKNDLALSRNVLMQNTNNMQAVFTDTNEKFIVRFYK